MNRSFILRHLVPRPSQAANPVASGLYHFQQMTNGQPVRYHLRVEADGSGMLVANATAAARLTPVGVAIANGLLENLPESAILRTLGKYFRGLSKEHLDSDIARVKNLLQELATPGDIYPIANLEDAAFDPHSASLMAPLEAWLPFGSNTQAIMKKAWEAAIPHVTLLLPDEFNPAELVKAVEFAENTGLVCGVSGRATPLLAHAGLLEQLSQAGVDHVTVFYASHQPELHDRYFGAGDHEAARNVFQLTQELGVADVGHIPLVPETLPHLEETLESLLLLRVPNAAIYAIASDQENTDAIPAQAMRQVAAQVEEEATEARVRYLWEVPVRRNPVLSLQAQVLAGPRCGSDFSIRIENDGAVIPPRGSDFSAGNMLNDPWRQIWEHPAFKNYRERVHAPTRCDVCPGLAICAAECPAEPSGWSFGTTRA